MAFPRRDPGVASARHHGGLMRRLVLLFALAVSSACAPFPELGAQHFDAPALGRHLEALVRHLDDFADALRQVNSTPYGLAAGVF